MGAIGTVVMVYEEPDIAYEIEFTDNLGQTISQVSLKSDCIAPYDS